MLHDKVRKEDILFETREERADIIRIKRAEQRYYLEKEKREKLIWKTRRAGRG
jgi:hypothetical protein